MAQIQAILHQLGVNQTIWVQLLLFLVSYFFLSQFLFKPYMVNLAYRKKSTTGNAEAAVQLNKATENLAMDYQGQVKNQNEKAAAIYDRLKAEGRTSEEQLLGSARADAAALLEQTKKQITADIGAAKENLKTQVPQLSRLMASRVLGRELS